MPSRLTGDSFARPLRLGPDSGEPPRETLASVCGKLSLTRNPADLRSLAAAVATHRRNTAERYESPVRLAHSRRLLRCHYHVVLFRAIYDQLKETTMKRISLVTLAAILFAAWTPTASATGFEPLGVDGLRRITGFGFGQGYHSYPKNPALRRAYQQAQCRQLPIQPPPAYPCSPRAPEPHRNCGACNGVGQQGMVQFATPQMMAPIGPAGTEMYSPVDAHSDHSHNNLQDVEKHWDADEAKNDWNDLQNGKRETETPKNDPVEDSPQREKLPTPKSNEEAKLPGEDMLDELESYFGEDVGPSPQSRQQSQIRRLPPTQPESPTTYKEPPSTNVYVDPAGPPKPKKTDIWW